jgi:hypothetical protein
MLATGYARVKAVYLLSMNRLAPVYLDARAADRLQGRTLPGWSLEARRVRMPAKVGFRG